MKTHIYNIVLGILLLILVVSFVSKNVADQHDAAVLEVGEIHELSEKLHILWAKQPKLVGHHADRGRAVRRLPVLHQQQPRPHGREPCARR
ncbi:hypothetical protein LCGC14_2802520 [marine sediment metagenome]|uniref:Uncharacterized protein n=1 Tax=marine sediment metagenome TaxID=412755 RepID=A0A0F9AVS4_9ZZZZ